MFGACLTALIFSFPFLEERENMLIILHNYEGILYLLSNY
jgi:hypothetical protein